VALTEPKLTGGEKAKVAWLVARMAKRGIAASNSPTGDVHQGDLQRKVDRITDRAAERTRREAEVAERQLEEAQRAVSAAKFAERASRGGERRAARDARRQAEQTLRRVQQAARKYGL